MRSIFLSVLTAVATLLLPQLLPAAEEAKTPDRPRPEMRRGGPNPEVMFQRLDANHDGVITADEIPAGMPERMKQLLLEELKRHDGKLTPEALTQAIQRHRPGVGPEGGPGLRGPGQGRGPGAGQGRGPGAGQGFGFGGGRAWNPEGGPGLRGAGQGRGPGAGQGFGFGPGRPWNAEGGPGLRGPAQGADFGAGRPWQPQGGFGPPWQAQRFGQWAGGPWHSQGGFGPPWQAQRFGGWAGGPWHPRGGRYAQMDRYWRPGGKGQQHVWQQGGSHKGLYAGMKKPKAAKSADKKGVDAKLAALEKETVALKKVEDSIKTKLIALEKRQEEVRAMLQKAGSPEKKPKEKKLKEKKAD